MSPHSALRARGSHGSSASMGSPRAAAPQADSGPAMPRRRTPSRDAGAELQRLSARLDQLMFDVQLGATSHRQHESHVEEAEAIAAGIRAVFRAPSAAQPAEHPPLWHRGGKAAW